MRARVLLALAPILATGCLFDGDGDAADAGLLRPDARPLERTGASLLILLSDETGAPLPGRVMLYDEDGRLVRVGKRDMWDGQEQDRAFCDLSRGVVGTWDGLVIPDGSGELAVGGDHCSPGPAVPYGRYRLVALQGIEHERYETWVDLSRGAGRVTVDATLERAFRPEGALAADLHVHALGSGDSEVPRDLRVQTELATGIQVIGASDHNLNSDYGEVIELMGLRGRIASLSGNEATADNMHVNVFPVEVVPGRRGAGAPGPNELITLSAGQMLARLRALPRTPFLQVNHPRLNFGAYFDSAGWDGRSWPPPMPLDFDGVEVLTGWYTYTRPGDARVELALQDFFTLFGHGRTVTALGNSDTHHLSSILAGIPRNYVFTDDPILDPFDEDAFVAALRARRVLATSGPWLEVTAGGASIGGTTTRVVDGKVRVTVRLAQASYVKADRLRVWVGGALREVVAIPAGARRFDWEGDMEVGTADSWIAVAADGTEPLPPDLHGDWLGGPDRPGMIPFALANPILVDADGEPGWRPLAAGPVPTRDLPPSAHPGSALECRPPDLTNVLER